MDLIRWQRRSVVLSCFPLPLGARPLAFVLRPPEKTGHKSALFVRNVALKEKKKEKKKGQAHTKEDIPRGSRQARCSALAHIPASLLCRPLFFYVLYLKKSVLR